MKLGSLFDGSGGFPLAGALCGIEPVWASEVEPYPIAVTKTRFPNMKHLGDISKINGAEIEPVDIITFGSPCQDLSVAGKRAGLKHENNGDDETTRSGLFMEAVRIIKEMREKTNGEYPRFAVWENVPGAFSSNKGEDFRIVLEELIKVVEPTAVMPDVPKNGWPYADSYCGDGWSLAYRVFDAQYWGVPQRRRRIYLVTDFRGQCAREISFEREGLRGYFAEGRTARKAVASDAERSVGADDREGEVPYTLKIRSGVSVDSYGKAAGKGALIQKNLSATLGVSQDQYLFQPTYGVDHVITTGGNCTAQGSCVYEDVQATLKAGGPHAVAYGISAYESNSMKSSNPHSGVYEATTSRTIDLNGANPACNQGGIAVVEPIAVATQQGGAEITENGICPTITAAAGMSGNNQPWICHQDNDGKTCVLDSIGGNAERGWESDVAPTLKATHYKMPPCIVESAGFCTEHSAKSRTIGYEEEVSPTLRAGVTPAVVYGFQRQLSGVEAQEDVAPTILAAAGESGNNKPCVVYAVENHPADSRVNVDDSGKVQTLTSRMGTGGGNVPMVMETVALEGNGQRPSHRGDGYAVTDKSYTLNSTEVHGVAYPAITASKASFFMKADEELASTLVATDYKDPQLVAYSFDPGASRDVGVLFIEECGKTLTNGTCPGHHDGVVIAEQPIAIDRAYFNQGQNAQYEPQLREDGTVSTLVAKGPSAVCVRYIVRRLTPTECARLQGFADRWGDIEPKSDFTDEEYQFWHDVRNTHATINGKAVKEYTKAQMITWYNKLHTDSAEYKLWGNGIALPTALYVIQGISDVLYRKEQNND